MNAFLAYEIKVALLIAAFYLCFRLLLCKEKLHRLNRVVLIGSALLSFILPLCVITVRRTVEIKSVPESAMAYIPEAAGPDAGGHFETMLPSAHTDASAGSGWWQVALVIIYCIGAMAVLANLVVSAIRIRRLIRDGKPGMLDGQKVIVTDRNVAPFSWMRWIVMPEADYRSGNGHILRHEQAHLSMGHSYEVLFISILAAFQWFNPAIWLLRGDLKDIHEFEADDAVLRRGANLKEYQYSLIRKAVSASGYSITNSFNHSILKNRITMMSKSKSPTGRGLRVLYVIPLVAVSLVCNARTETVYKVTQNSGETVTADSKEAAVLVEVRRNPSERNGISHLYLVDGVQVALENLGQAVRDRADSEKVTVRIKADADVKCGAITDIKEALRKASITNVAYTATDADRAAPNWQSPDVVKANGVEVYDFGEVPRNGIYQVRMNSLNRIMYSRYDGNTVVLNDMEAFRADLEEIIRKNVSAGKQYVFLLQCDRGTDFDAYRQIEDILTGAYGSIREEYAMSSYSKPFAELTAEQQDAVRIAIPYCIAEAARKSM